MLSAIFHFIKEKAINKSVGKRRGRGRGGCRGLREYRNEPENYHLVVVLLAVAAPLINAGAGGSRRPEMTGNRTWRWE